MAVNNDLNRISVPVDYYKVMFEDKDLMIVECDVVSEGLNRHGTIFDIEDIKRNTYKLANKPVNCLITRNDFGNHAFTKQELKKQIAIGTVPETNMATIIVKDGKHFQRINMIIWKYLFPDAVEIFNRRKTVEVSMEIDPIEVERVEAGRVKIKDWNYQSITVLGRNVMPAIAGAKATVIKFSANELKDKTDKVLLKYSVFSNNIVLPIEVSNEVKDSLKTNINDLEWIKFASEIKVDEQFSIDDIYKLNKYSLKHGFYKSIKWSNEIIKLKIGENMDIVELLKAKFSGDKFYTSNDETTVTYFDFSDAKYKKVTYACGGGEDKEKYDVIIGEEITVVEEKEEKKCECGEEGCPECNPAEGSSPEGDSMEMAMVKKCSELYSTVLAELNLAKQELESKTVLFAEVESKLADAENKYSTLEESVNAKDSEIGELQTKIIAFSTLETEMVDLREIANKYAVEKEALEKEKKQSDANALYVKYAEFLSDDEITELNTHLFALPTFEAFSDKVRLTILPKAEAKLEALKVQVDTPNSGLQFSTIPVVPNVKDKEEKYVKQTSTQKLKEYTKKTI